MTTLRSTSGSTVSTPHLSVLVLADAPCSGATALLDQDGVDGEWVPPDEVAASVDVTTDCLVVCVDALPTAAAATANRAVVPIVECDGDADTPAALLERVREAAGRDADRITRLHAGTADLISLHDHDALFERVVTIAADVLEFDTSVVFAREDDGRFRRVAVDGHGHVPATLPVDHGLTAAASERGEPMLVDDIEDHPVATSTAKRYKSGLIVPLGERYVFEGLATERERYDAHDLELAELLCAHATETAARIDAERTLAERERTMTALHRAAPELIDAEDEQALFDRTVDIAERVLSFDRSYLLLADEDADRFVFVAGTDDEIDDYPPNAGVLGRTYETGEPELVEDATDHDAARPAHDSTRAAISVPLGDVGVFQALSTEPGAFDETDLHCAELLMAHVAVSLERIRAEAQLRSERDRFEALFENIPGAAIAYEMVGGEPIVRRINEAFERSFGFGEATILDESLDDHIVPPAASEAADEYNDRLERGERVQAEVERRTANGTRHFLLQVIPLEVGAENERGFAIYSDVSDRKQREEELRRQNERLDEFASVVSHDLRNPLSVASGFLELARETGDPAHLDRIERALDRMDDLVTDLLVLAREGRDVGETERVALGEMARTAWANVSTNDGVLRVGTEAEVEADPDRLVALFENLFRNSLEHGHADEAAASSGDGGSPPALTITVDDLTDETGVLSGFVVADDGVGIDADFDPFETGATSTESGTGFGLAIVKSIAEAHGWTVSAGESDSGGARFEFSF